MHVIVTGHRIDLTPAMQHYVAEKFGKLDQYLHHLDEDQRTATVTVKKVTGKGVKVNFDYYLPEKVHVYAEKEHEDFYIAVDELLNVAEREVAEYNDQHGG